MPPATNWFFLCLAASVVGLLAALTAYLARSEADAVERRGLGRAQEDRPSADTEGTKTAPPSGDSKRRIAVIVNPTKFDDVAEMRAMIRRTCIAQGWADPWWAETTIDEPGRAQAKAAIDAGVDVVCPLGGDGTVRSVASALVDSGMPIGLLPGGTGNLLARNLELPVDSIRRSLMVILTGRNAHIDTCLLSLTRPPADELQGRKEDPEDTGRNIDMSDAAETPGTPEVEQHTFLVMAGLGFDAEVMATAPEDLKATIGWGAYVFAGAQHLKGPRFHVDVRFANGNTESRDVRSVIVGNVGKLQGGFQLLPEARSDDGLVTALLLYPRGLLGWASIWRRLIIGRDIGPPARLKHFSSTRVQVTASKPVQVQIDGDTLGAVSAMDVEVKPQSLIVRLPATSK